jgi:hypothetical protein
MSRTYASLLVLLGLLAAAYVCFFTDWFRGPGIQITPSVRPVLGLTGEGVAYPVSFTLDGKYALTSIKVLSLAEWSTNRHAAPLWHLISSSNSWPTRGFTYGMRIRGMKPSEPQSTAKSLRPNESYRLFVEAGRVKGQVDFRPQGPAEPEP